MAQSQSQSKWFSSTETKVLIPLLINSPLCFNRPLAGDRPGAASENTKSSIMYSMCNARFNKTKNIPLKKIVAFSQQLQFNFFAIREYGCAQIKIQMERYLNLVYTFPAVSRIRRVFKNTLLIVYMWQATWRHIQWTQPAYRIN